MKINKNIAIVFLFFFISLYILQFTAQEIIGYDGYLHIKIADLTKEGVVKDFPWVTESITAENYSDHQFLFRILLIPFSYLGLMYGAKLASVLFSALCFTVFYWFLTKHKISYPFIWTLTYAVSSVFLMYRFLLPRPMPLIIISFILTIHFIEKKNYLGLAIITFLLNWISPAFIFQLMIIGLYFLINLLIKKKINIKLILYPSIAIILALLLNPYFPKNIYFLYIQLFKVNLLGNLYNQEWRAWPIKEFFVFNYLLLSLFLLSIYVNIKNKLKINKKTIMFGVITIIFLIFTITSRRMQEFLVPFVILFASFSLNEKIKKLKNDKTIKIILVILIIIIASLHVYHLKKQINEAHFLPRYKECALWMKEDIPEESNVFINGYSFSYLFFYNSDIYYTHGVDLTYSHLKDPIKFEAYMNILKGNYPDYNSIKQDYDADYVFVGKTKLDKNFAEFIIKYKNDFELLYENDDCAILKIKND